MNLKTVLVVATLLSAFSAHAAELTINGTVLEKGTRNPLQGVVVSVQDQTVLSAVSDSRGHFQITLPAAGSYNLIASNSGITAKLDVEVTEGKSAAIADVLPARAGDAGRDGGDGGTQSRPGQQE